MLDYGKYFTESEFVCKCGCGSVDMQKVLIEKLNHARALLGEPMILNSAYRCVTHNKKVGGLPNSFHLFGFAVDIACGSHNRVRMISSLYDAGFKGIGVYDSFIHADVGTEFDRSWIG